MEDLDHLVDRLKEWMEDPTSHPDLEEGFQRLQRGLPFREPTANDRANELCLRATKARGEGAFDQALNLLSRADRLECDRETRYMIHVEYALIYYAQRKINPEYVKLYQHHCYECVRLGHIGSWPYERLAIDLEKEGRYADAIAICERAIATPGFRGSIPEMRHRLKRLRRKQAEKNKKPRP